jgi:hypothetical protein
MFAVLHVAPTATSCVSSPVAVVLTTLSAPHLLTVRNGVPWPTVAAWISPVAAVVWQMPSGPVFTTTASCSAVAGAITCSSARAKPTASRTSARIRIEHMIGLLRWRPCLTEAGGL